MKQPKSTALEAKDLFAEYTADNLKKNGYVNLSLLHTSSRRLREIFKVCVNLHPKARMVTGLGLYGRDAIIYLPRYRRALLIRLRLERAAYYLAAYRYDHQLQRVQQQVR